MNLDNSNNFNYVQDNYPRIYDVGLIDPNLLIDSDDFTKNIFFSMFGFYSLYGSPELDWITEEDPHNSYRLNSYGYRDPEYEGPVDLIAAGCSQTFGQGVPEEWRWSSLLGKKLNMSVATIAVPGWSAMGAINAVMSHIINYGKPKVVALYLPDFFRFDYVRNKKILIDGVEDQDSEGQNTSRIDIGHSGHVRKMPKVSKRPHLTSEVINPETSVFMNGQVLRFFLEYCKEAKIEVVWGTWESGVQELVKYLKSTKFNSEQAERISKIDLSNYVDIDYAHDGFEPLEKFSLKSCHKKEKEELDSSLLKYYDYGSDVHCHIGIHVHMHVADAFYKRLHRLEA